MYYLDIPLDLDKIVDFYARKHPKKMVFLNSLGESEIQKKLKTPKNPTYQCRNHHLLLPHHTS